MTSDLLPCPFCGSQPSEAIFGEGFSAVISCYEKDCLLSNLGYSPRNKAHYKKAVRQWNKMANSITAAQAEIASLRAQLVDVIERTGDDIAFLKRQLTEKKAAADEIFGGIYPREMEATTGIFHDRCEELMNILTKLLPKEPGV